MRIAMLVHNRIHFGTFQRAHSLARHLVRLGHELTICAGAAQCGRPPRYATLDGVTIVEPFDPLPIRFREGGLSPFDVLNRLHYLLRRPCDLIHCFDHRPSVSLPGLLLARLRKIPSVIDWADLWGFEGIASERSSLMGASLGAFDTVLETAVRRKADALTVISTALQRRAQGRFPAPVHLLPVGANSDLIKPISKAEARGRLGFPENASIAVHTGLAPYDAEFLAQSFLQLVKLQPGALLVTTGRRFPALDRAIFSAGLTSQFTHLGMLGRDALPQVFACADALLLPYTDRSVNRFRYPNKLGDYLAAGRPIVTNRTGDLGQLVAEERVGLLADDTPEAFASSIKQLFDDAALRDELGRRARLLAESKLDWGFLAAGLERFYLETIARVRR